MSPTKDHVGAWRTVHASRAFLRLIFAPGHDDLLRESRGTGTVGRDLFPQRFGSRASFPTAPSTSQPSTESSARSARVRFDSTRGHPAEPEGLADAAAHDKEGCFVHRTLPASSVLRPTKRC